eukprot:80154-Hanusia_phi.AAC.4
MALRPDEALMLPDALLPQAPTQGAQEVPAAALHVHPARQTQTPEHDSQAHGGRSQPPQEALSTNWEEASSALSVDRSTEAARGGQVSVSPGFSQASESPTKISGMPGMSLDRSPDLEHRDVEFDRSLPCDILTDAPASFYDHWSGLNFSLEAARTLKGYGHSL